jgi:hypothetical protein
VRLVQAALHRYLTTSVTLAGALVSPGFFTV